MLNSEAAVAPLYICILFYLGVDKKKVSHRDASSSDTSGACSFHEIRTNEREDASDHRAHSASESLSEIKPPFYETCELHDLVDNKAIGNECVSEKQRCADGSYNKTCIILSIGPDGRQSSKCRCHDNRKPKLPTAKYHWSRWYRLTDSRIGLYREIKDVLDTDPQHDQALAKEYRCVQGSE